MRKLIIIATMLVGSVVNAGTIYNPAGTTNSTDEVLRVRTATYSTSNTYVLEIVSNRGVNQVLKTDATIQRVIKRGQLLQIRGTFTNNTYDATKAVVLSCSSLANSRKGSSLGISVEKPASVYTYENQVIIMLGDNSKVTCQ